jgi:pyridoxine kinase
MYNDKILSIQDISCVGQCSLTVALPILSACGIETAILPTAVLSTHTGGEKFKNFTFHDLTEEIPKISNHWKSIDMKFGAIYTGYLGSFKQLHYVSDVIDDFKSDDTLIFVDPAMADNGKLYVGFTPDFVKEMAKLCGKADIIVPNLTEACFMLNEEYIPSGYDETYIDNLLIKLSNLGAKKVIITGVAFEEGKLGVACYDSLTGEKKYYFRDLIGKTTHGTGDVFASSFLGAYLNGKSLEESIKIAAEFVCAAIENTIPFAEEHWYGVRFESVLPKLNKWIK